MAKDRPPGSLVLALASAVISCAVRWYFSFQLSLRDIDEYLRGATYSSPAKSC